MRPARLRLTYADLPPGVTSLIAIADDLALLVVSLDFPGLPACVREQALNELYARLDDDARLADQPLHSA